MKCPYCQDAEDRVVDSRETREGTVIRRRRECQGCSRRFTSYERIEQIPYMVVKKDGKREAFDRAKVLNGLLTACEKRPVPVRKLEEIVEEAETLVQESSERELSTEKLGELAMTRLRELDKVAFVRFASVYRQFEDVNEFLDELRGLIGTRSRKSSSS
ncbi:MAG: transcriptional repressor NrdR [Acidobacteria bacterium]|nr:MAG: transcriptional repressor NrdR [Acidobacteriota bacterium]